MLQQTQVDRVIPKYRAFLRMFPTMRALARAPLWKVIGLWSGLGYNRRALYLKQAASMSMFGGSMFRGSTSKQLAELALLEKLPGVGKYTARAVAAFAFDVPVAALDTNGSRVLHRWFYGVEAPRRRVTDAHLTRIADTLVPRGKAWEFNHALMDFGAAVCTARRPKCASCPFRTRCRAYPKILDIRNWKLEIGRRRAEPFVGSNRYWRGRIIELLRHASRHSLPLVSMLQLLGSGMTPVLLRSLTVGLAKDHLVVLKRATLSLPK